MKLLNVAIVLNFEVMLGQMLNHCLEFCNFVLCRILVKYSTSSLSVCVSPFHNFLTKWLKFMTELLVNVRKVGGLVLMDLLL
jgi:hypothetical protein